LLEKYAEHGTNEFRLPDALRVPPLSERGTPAEIVQYFGGFERLKTAVLNLEKLIYIAEEGSSHYTNNDHLA
jgi:type I restriction enzyme R subunit